MKTKSKNLEHSLTEIFLEEIFLFNIILVIGQLFFDVPRGKSTILNN